MERHPLFFFNLTKLLTAYVEILYLWDLTTGISFSVAIFYLGMLDFGFRSACLVGDHIRL